MVARPKSVSFRLSEGKEQQIVCVYNTHIIVSRTYFLTFVIQQNVLGLYVSVGDTKAVEVLL